jgi:hypothetical protein
MARLDALSGMGTAQSTLRILNSAKGRSIGFRNIGLAASFTG